MWAQSGSTISSQSGSNADELVRGRSGRRAVVGAAQDQRRLRDAAQLVAQVEHPVLPTGRKMPQHLGPVDDPIGGDRAPRRVGLSDRRRGTASGRRATASPAPASRRSPRAPTRLRPGRAAPRARSSPARARRWRARRAARPSPSGRTRTRCRGAPCGSEPRTTRTTSRSRRRPRARARAISASTSSAICGTVHRAGSPASERPLPRWSGASDAVALLGDAVETGEPDRAVETRATVEGDERPPLPVLVDVELDVADRDAHQNVASRTPEAISERGCRPRARAGRRRRRCSCGRARSRAASRSRAARRRPRRSVPTTNGPTHPSGRSPLMTSV